MIFPHMLSNSLQLVTHCDWERIPTSCMRLYAPEKAQREKPQAGQMLRVGKTGDVIFDGQTRVGDMVLEAGPYKVDHRVAGSDHFLHFTKVSKPNPYYRGGSVPVAHPGEIKCGLETLSQKASRTAVYLTKEGSGHRITKVEIQGENVAHIF